MDPESIFFRVRYILLTILVVSITTSIILIYQKANLQDDGVEILDTQSTIVVEIAGAVETPGVYKLTRGSRVEDLLILANGISSNADRNWFSKNINRARELIDGEKIYILSVEETKQLKGGSAKKTDSIKVDQGVKGVQNSSLVNINTDGTKTIETLPGIGPVYAQKVIEQRPYSNTMELVEKSIIPKNLYEKIKDLIII